MSGKERHYRSGAQKRKAQQEKLESISKIPKINTFFKKTCSESPVITEELGSNTVDPVEGSNTYTIDTGTDDGLVLANPDENVESVKEEPSSVNSGIDSADSEYSENEQEQLIPSESTSVCVGSPFSTDRALFPEQLSEEEKRKILVSGPCRPPGPFPKDGHTNRSFSSKYYCILTKTGQKIERFWLCYSKILNAVYCQPCWLFSESGPMHPWCNGSICDWKGLSKKIKTHENSAMHLKACTTYSIWEKSKTVDNFFTESNKTIKQILIRILDVTRTLAVCNLPFRGHRENVSSIGPQSGNFLNVVDLLSRYDPLLKSHLANSKTRNKYLHHDQQNEMITLMANSVKQKIVAEISKAPFFQSFLIQLKIFLKEINSVYVLDMSV